MQDDAPTPIEVFKLIERADERVKYAQNRDAADAFAQARESLARASELAARLHDSRARAALQAQIAKRLDDVKRLEGEGQG
ncbi:MAG: hypothetical protein NVSMB57_00140 [Actinomycetota bacterium]